MTAQDDLKHKDEILHEIMDNALDLQIDNQRLLLTLAKALADTQEITKQQCPDESSQRSVKK